MSDLKPNAELAATDLIVKFERIGRTGSTPEAALTVHVPAHFADDPERVAEYLYSHVRRHLASRCFDVSVDFEADKVYIEGGRFGRGDILRPHPGVAS